jgi:hypothetical protein
MSDHPKKENADAPATRPEENTENEKTEIPQKDLDNVAGGGMYWEGDDWNSEGS